jgi:purine-nucleoside phosphorylase
MLKAADQLRRISQLRPRLGIVLGTGFGAVSRHVEIEARVSYAQLPGFPGPRVPGHAGEVLLGRLGGTAVVVLSGRAHFYEGWPMEEVTFPVRVLAEYGVKALLLTNAAGGINRRLEPGDLMVISDHINFMGANPLRGKQPLKVREPRKHAEPTGFVDLCWVYDPAMRKLLFQSARSAHINLRSGVYLAVSGPSYETPAEIRAFRKLGADAVGMSTVPEVIAARQHGLKVAAVSCITNLAGDPGARPLTHEEVLQMGRRVEKLAAQLLIKFAMLYPSHSD